MGKPEKAVDYFRNKFNCSQSVFTVFGTEQGMSEDDSLKVSCAFGGGMGRQQHTCGAVTGALMALGLKYGKALNDPEEKKQQTYALTREFFQKFTELNGSVNCKVLLDGLDMNDPDDHKTIMDRKLFDIKCEKYVADAVTITEKLMEK
ncbi:MAG: C_GCAxxG_C_C family protein [Bacteroidetes bacterium]|nr:C_GCAxxG_C_C family protein [Bacteroidota bacterium]